MPRGRIISPLRSRSLFSRGRLSGGGGGGSSDIPVYNPLNADHVLHFTEDWSGYAGVANIYTQTRADGGAPPDSGPTSNLSFSSTGLSGYGEVKKLVIDYTAAPAANTSSSNWGDYNDRFGTGVGGAVWLNQASQKSSFVLEWCFQYHGAPYIGKISDFQPTGGTDRFNLQSGTDAMGFHNLGNDPNPDTDPLTSIFYSSGGTVKKLRSDELAWGGPGFVINRTAQGDPTWPYLVAYPQMMNWGAGAGQFQTGGSGNSNVGISLVGQWVRIVQRFTLNAGGTAGFGRIEEWAQIGSSIVKTKEYYGDSGLLCAGQVRGRDTTQGSTWVTAGSHWSFFNLTAVGGIYLGGCTVDIGFIRHWSHTKLSSPVINFP